MRLALIALLAFSVPALAADKPVKIDVGAKLAGTQRIEVRDQGKVTNIKDAGAIADVLKAVGANAEVKPGELRRCGDTLRVTFHDAKDAELGELGFCGTGGLNGKTPTEGAEFGWGKGGMDRGAIKLADEGALVKALKASK